MRIKLGSKVKDEVSGFVGIAENCAEYLYGCDRYGVQPPIDKDGKLPDDCVFDDMQLKVLRGKPVVEALPFPKQVVMLGDEVFDPITGMTGIAAGRCLYLNGCARIRMECPIAKDGEVEAQNYWTDELGLEIKTKGKIKIKDPVTLKPVVSGVPLKRTGGPGRAASQKW